MFDLASTRKNDLIEKSNKLGYLYHAKSPSPPLLSPHLIDGGLLTLSKYPITYVKFKPYKSYSSVDLLS